MNALSCGCWSLATCHGEWHDFQYGYEVPTQWHNGNRPEHDVGVQKWILVPKREQGKVLISLFNGLGC